MNRLAFYDAVYDLLVNTGNIRDDKYDKQAFSRYFTFTTGPNANALEWRFQGHLGFGGKFWCSGNDESHHVSYYGREDWSQERDDMVKSLNAAIVKLELEHRIYVSG